MPQSTGFEKTPRLFTRGAPQTAHVCAVSRSFSPPQLQHFMRAEYYPGLFRITKLLQ